MAIDPKRKHNNHSLHQYNRNSKEERAGKPKANITAKKAWYEKIIWKKFIVTSVFLYVLFNFIGGCFTIYDLKKQEHILIGELKAAQEEKAKLENMVAYMSTDEAVEKMAREKLGLIKPGEIIIVRADDANGQ